MPRVSDYPAGMRLRPIEVWPGPLTKSRVRSPFSASMSTTLTELERELSFLSTSPRRLVAPSVLQIAMREEDFRVTDGMPRMGAKAQHPGVILSVEAASGPLSFPCDKFDRWQDNLRAITLSLEALRRVDRYGVTRNGEQYTGWKAIEAGSGFVSADAAERWLRTVIAPHDPDSLRAVMRAAKAVASPDRHNGDRALWDKVDAAVQLLERTDR